MKVNSIAIFANTENENVKLTLEEMKSYFESIGKDVVLVSLKGKSEDYELDVPKTDLAISLGGDGTVLTCAVVLKDSGIPLMAVNMGSFGYITAVPVSEYKEVFKSFEEGTTELQTRIMLHISVIREGKTASEFTALNDAVITASSMAKLAYFSLFINKTLASTLKADGLLVATPTGSTAYSLSAGGPVLEANLNSFIINPICPFSMSVRPLIVSDKSVIEIEIPKQKADIVLTADGHNVFELKEKDLVVIKKSDVDAVFVGNNKRNFIEVLRDKLTWAGGFNA